MGTRLPLNPRTLRKSIGKNAKGCKNSRSQFQENKSTNQVISRGGPGEPELAVIFFCVLQYMYMYCTVKCPKMSRRFQGSKIFIPPCCENQCNILAITYIFTLNSTNNFLLSINAMRRSSYTLKIASKIKENLVFLKPVLQNT